MNKSKTVLSLVFTLFLACVFSCQSVKTQEDRLAPRRSAGSIRLDDIQKQLAENPVKALDLIGIYREVYHIDDADALAALETDAIERLRQLQAAAITEERWDDAASFSRSLASLGVAVESTGQEPDFVLATAKKKLADGNILGAFLAAVQANELRPLSFDDALLFLERGV